MALTRCCREKTAEGVALLQEGGDNLARRVRRGMSTFGRRVWLSGMVVVAVASRFPQAAVDRVGGGDDCGPGLLTGRSERGLGGQWRG